MYSSVRVKNLVKIAILGAISFVIMLFELPLWFAPGFYELDLSEVVVLMGGFAMGSLAAAGIEGLKIVLNLLLNGTVTGGVGELANFLLGCAFVMPAVFIYRRHKNKKGAVLGMILGILALAALAMVLNRFVLLPAFSVAFGAPIDAFVQMGSDLNPFITDINTFILWAVLPFNIVKGIICAAATLLLYKKMSRILHK